MGVSCYPLGTTTLLREGCVRVDMFAAFREEVEDPQNVVEAYGKRAALFNAGLVAGLPHAEFARVHTDLAFKRGVNVARSREIEFLVRLSGRRQIEKALEIGVVKGAYMGVLAEDDVIRDMEEKWERDDSLFEVTEEKERRIREFFEVEGKGKMLQKNIFEKIALVSVFD